MSQNTGKVLYNVTQDLDYYKKAQARSNIGAASESSVTSLSNSVSSLGTTVSSLNTIAGNHTTQITTINNILSATEDDAGKALVVNSSGNPEWIAIDTAPSKSRLSEFTTNSNYTLFGTNYGKDNKRQIHTFTYGTYPNNISSWIQEKDYNYGILHYTIALNLYNSDSATKWCVIDQGHILNTELHTIGKGLYVPFVPGYSYVPVDHSVVFFKSDVGSISSTIQLVMGLATWYGDDSNFHTDDSFMVNIIHSDLTLFAW